MRPIDADEIINYCTDKSDNHCKSLAFVEFMACIDEMPTLEVEEIRYGKWIPCHIKHETWNEFGYRCSLCKAEIDESWFSNMISTNRCPYCDAKMNK